MYLNNTSGNIIVNLGLIQFNEILDINLNELHSISIYKSNDKETTHGAT